MNPRAATNDLLPFQGSPFNHLGTSAWLNLDSIFILTGSLKTCQRRGWDSNPRALADKRTTSIPLHVLFLVLLSRISLSIIQNIGRFVKDFFQLFLFFSQRFPKSAVFPQLQGFCRCPGRFSAIQSWLPRSLAARSASATYRSSGVVILILA